MSAARNRTEADPLGEGARLASADPSCPASTQLVARVERRAVDFLLLAREVGEGALDLVPHPAQGNPKDALTTLKEVEHLRWGGALKNRSTIAEQGHLGEVIDAALAQVLNRQPDLVQRDAGVEEPFDDFEDEDVPEAVEPLRAGAGGAPN